VEAGEIRAEVPEALEGCQNPGRSNARPGPEIAGDRDDRRPGGEPNEKPIGEPQGGPDEGPRGKPDGTREGPGMQLGPDVGTLRSGTQDHGRMWMGNRKEAPRAGGWKTAGAEPKG
jgi:hypothetical protein